MKSASFPNHAHKHKHGGVEVYSHTDHYATGDSHCGMGGTRCSEKTNSNRGGTIKIDFSVMQESTAFVSDIKGSDIQLKENELFPPHLRVYYLFKCV